MRSFQTDSTMIWNSKKKDLQTHFLFVSSETGAAMRIIPDCLGGRPCDTPWSHLVDFTGVFVELELSHEKWLSEELAPILDSSLGRNFLFCLNNGSKCEWNISVCFQMTGLLGWKRFYAWYYLGEIPSRRRKEKECMCLRAHVSVF